MTYYFSIIWNEFVHFSHAKQHGMNQNINNKNSIQRVKKRQTKNQRNLYVKAVNEAPSNWHWMHPLFALHATTFMYIERYCRIDKPPYFLSFSIIYFFLFSLLFKVCVILFFKREKVILINQIEENSVEWTVTLWFCQSYLHNTYVRVDKRKRIDFLIFVFVCRTSFSLISFCFFSILHTHCTHHTHTHTQR